MGNGEWVMGNGEWVIGNWVGEMASEHSIELKELQST